MLIRIKKEVFNQFVRVLYIIIGLLLTNHVNVGFKHVYDRI